MKRREFIALLGGAARVAVCGTRAAEPSADWIAVPGQRIGGGDCDRRAFLQRLREAG